MRKLSLDPDALRVQSFATATARAFPYGTVHGRQDPPPSDAAQPGCDPRDPTRPPGCPADTEGKACPGNNPTQRPECRETAECRETEKCDPPPGDSCPGPYSKYSCVHGGAA